MNTTSSGTTFSFDETFPEGIHLCYIYNDDEERVRTMAKFFAGGFSSGQKALSIVDTVTPHDLRQTLSDMGIDLAADKGNFATAPNDTSYCPDGSFEPDSLLGGIGVFCQQAREEGFTGARISGDMSWALRKQVTMPELMEYEVKVTDYLKSCPFTAICEYDARKFDGATLMDILSVHPAMIVRGHVVRNPYYVPPQEFLEQYRARKQ
jgi:hypothetical protein